MTSRVVDRARFDGYVESLVSAVGHADRRWPLEAYVTGLLLPGERKSIEPVAARVDPANVGRAHQALHHFVAVSPWDEREVLRVAREYALELLERQAPVAGWVIDETSFPKKGRHSVGVARQYCGTLGKEANCQVAVSVSLANRSLSVPAGWRLYLPKEWTSDPERCASAGVPPEVTFLKKWEIALESIGDLLADDVPRAPVIADSAYGDATAFRDALTGHGLKYVLAVKGDTTVWPPGEGPVKPKRKPGGGRPPTRLKRSPQHQPVSIKRLAASLPADAWREVRWREGSKGILRSRFATLRVRPAHRDNERTEPRNVERLLIQWPSGSSDPTKYWLSTLGEQTEIGELVSLAKLRWRIERDYQELKDELGLDHFEGRNWRGFHHHGVLCIAAYAFLAAERGRLSPPQAPTTLRSVPLPENFTPRGSPRQTRTA
ncbi:MAG: IS701 family transposase [Trueperaceae bacterium]